jgi:hypothetical protein
MTNDPKLVDLETVASPIIAGMIVQALESAGIPAFAKGCPLSNEYALAHKFLGVRDMTIQVPEERLDEAKAIRAMMHESGKTLEKGEDRE